MASDNKKYGYAKIYEPLLNDLKVLEIEGILIHNKLINVKLRGSNSFFASDNLGANSLAGLVESFHTKTCNELIIFF